MPAWLLTLLLKYALPIVIDWLRKSGHVSAAEALVAKGAAAVYNEVKDLKTYPEFPDPSKRNRPF